MFKFLTALFLVGLMTFSAAAQQISEANYRIYSARGNPATLTDITASLKNAEVVFIGENHADAVAHYLQAELLKSVFDIYGKERKIALSLEMFERDVQIVLDEYLGNLISETHFLNASRPWNNYKTDYRPLVEYARQNKLAVIAANAPRRYVNMVSRGGREVLNSLSQPAKNWIAPLPYAEPSKAYADKFNALMGKMPEADMGLNKILASQSLWDATMAFSISEHLRKQENSLVVHLNGGFHSESRLGAVEHLQRYAPKARVLVVTIMPAEDFTSFDKAKYENLGDFVVLTDSKVPRSFK